MLQSKSFVKKTKKGKVLKVVREHYLRDDIWSGTSLDPECDPSAYKLSPEAPHYLVVDTNIVLQQMDFLEAPGVDDVVVMGVVLEEVRHRNMSVYQRLRALTANPSRRFYVFGNEYHKDTYITAEPGETPNDRNDRAIRAGATWYAHRLPAMPVLLLTNDADNRARARAEGLSAMSVQEYARSRMDCPELMDLVAAGGGAGEAAEAMQTDGKAPKRQRIYEDHRPLSDITAGLKSGRYHQGVFHASRTNCYKGRIAAPATGEDILLNGREATNRAFSGDVVAVELLPAAQWGRHSKDAGAGPATNAARDIDGAGGGGGAAPGEERDGGGAHLLEVGEAADDDIDVESAVRPCGRVVGIIKRGWRQRGYAGSLQPPRAGAKQPADGRPATVLFCPIDRSLPFVRLTTRQAETLMDQRLVAVVDAWEADSAYPVGHYVRALGPIGDVSVETEVIILEHDIRTQPFSPAVHACVPPLPWAVAPADFKDRADLRHLAVCSVDPPGCKDIDDALHVRELPNGNLEVGVHIADVTHFLEPGTPMDAEAAERGTTTYLVQTRIDMLPKPLTEDICSLRAGEARLAFSILWEVTPGAAIVGRHFTKSVILSTAALTYQEAQARIDDARLDDPVSAGLRRLNALARILRARRAANGALQLASPEVRFEIDTETHDPLDVGMYQVREANQMVEEMMLLANVTVADIVLEHFPACALLRRHPVPAPHQFDPLLRAAAAVGISMDVSSSKALAGSLDRAVRAGDAYFNVLIRILATRCMTQAVYFGSGDLAPPEYLHYGLAAALYTHFTYADVVVHRLLAAALGIRALPGAARDAGALRTTCANLNARHRGAQLAGRASVELHTLVFFRARTALADARVIKVRANAITVFVPKYGIEGPVHLTEKPAVAAAAAAAATGGLTQPQPPGAGTELVLDEEKQVVASRDGTLRFAVFDALAVRISVVEGAGRRRALLLELADRGALPAVERMG